MAIRKVITHDQEAWAQERRLPGVAVRKVITDDQDVFDKCRKQAQRAGYKPAQGNALGGDDPNR